MNSPGGPATAPPARGGVTAALGAYLIWGLVPVFFKWLSVVPALEIIAHRVVWSALLMGGFLAARGGFGQVRDMAKEPRRLIRVALGSAMIMGNWLTFVWAVNANRILETSLGYFVNPLVSVALAMVFLGERLRPLQWAALALAVAGVANEILRTGGLPWVSLVLAATFGLYGLLRKQLAMGAAEGLFLETALAVPFALGWLTWLGLRGEGAFALSEPGTAGLLVLSGPVTAIPLLLFAIGARRLPLTTIGMLQYLAPSITFLLAIFAYGEAMDLHRAASFAAIWAGLALYTLDLLRRRT